MLGKILAAHQSMIEKETLCSIAPLIKGGRGDLKSDKEIEIDEGFVISLTLSK